MAERAVSIVSKGQDSKLVVWTGLLNADTGEPCFIDHGDWTVTFEGTFGTGGTIKLEGSNDGTNFYDLTDSQANVISKTAAGIEFVVEAPFLVRPNVMAGDGSTNLQCRIMARRR